MTFKTYKVLVEIEVLVDADMPVDEPYLGINAIANSYAEMAIKYKSIGASSATVVDISAVK